MTSHVELRPGAYADSVTLLQVSRTVQGLDGVQAAQVAMATPLNVDVLTEMGFDVPAEAGPNDLVVALRVDGPDALAGALAGVEQALKDANRRESGPSELAPPRTTGSGFRRTPDAIALVSVPGANAFVEAMDAIDSGHDVMVFSDNVPLEQEIALKRAAAERGAAGDGPGLRDRRRRRARPRLRQHRLPRAGRHRRRLRHRLPAAARAARPRRCRRRVGTRRRRPRPVRRGPRPRDPRGAAPAGRGRRGRADRPGLQAPGRRRRRRDRGVRRRPVHAGRVRAARRRPSRPHRRDRGGAAPARPRGAGLAGDWLGAPPGAGWSAACSSAAPWPARRS